MSLSFGLTSTMEGNDENKLVSPPSSEVNEEDEQMNKFYALLENIRVAREYRRASNPNKKQKKDHSSPSSSSTWQPKFEWEDFRAGEQATGIVIFKGGEDCKLKGHEKGNEGTSSLVLKLSL